LCRSNTLEHENEVVLGAASLLCVVVRLAAVGARGTFNNLFGTAAGSRRFKDNCVECVSVAILLSSAIFVVGAFVGGCVAWFIRSVIADVRREDEAMDRRARAQLNDIYMRTDARL
jgi:hypothetical protein